MKKCDQTCFRIFLVPISGTLSILAIKSAALLQHINLYTVSLKILKEAPPCTKETWQPESQAEDKQTPIGTKHIITRSLLNYYSIHVQY